MFLFGTGCIRLFCKACIFSWCYIFICSWRCSFPFLLIILKNHSILHKIGSILHFRFCSVMNVYTICHIPAQIPFVEKSRSSLNSFWVKMVKRKKKKTWAFRLQDSQVCYISKMNSWIEVNFLHVCYDHKMHTAMAKEGSWKLKMTLAANI